MHFHLLFTNAVGINLHFKIYRTRTTSNQLNYSFGSGPNYYLKEFVLSLEVKTQECNSFFTDSEFQLSNSASGFCLVKTTSHCSGIRWTTADRLLVPQIKKCLGVQGKSVGSEVGLYICNENSEFQKWECKNGTLLALKGQELYIELTADNTAVLSRAIGPNNHLTVLGTSKGACTRTYRGTVQYATCFFFAPIGTLCFTV